MIPYIFIFTNIYFRIHTGIAVLLIGHVTKSGNIPSIKIFYRCSMKRILFQYYSFYLKFHFLFSSDLRAHVEFKNFIFIAMNS